MKKTIALLSILMVSLALNAAVFYTGAGAGLTMNGILASRGYRNYEYGMGMGAKLSIPFVVEFNDSLGLETGLSFYGKNYTYSQIIKESSGKDRMNFDLAVQNGFLTLPVMFRLNIPLGEADIYCALGGFAGIWLYGNRSGKVTDIYDTAENVNEKTDRSLYNWLDAGAGAKIGADIRFENCKGYVEGEYDISITNINKPQKYGEYTARYSTFTITFGILWGINK